MGALEQSSLKTTSFQGHFNPLWMYSGKKYRPITAYGQGLLMQSSFKHLTEGAQIRSITKAASSKQCWEQTSTPAMNLLLREPATLHEIEGPWSRHGKLTSSFKLLKWR